MTNNSYSIRLDKEYVSFSEKVGINRVKIDIDKKTLGHPQISKLIVKYFKDHNDRYLELIKMEMEKRCLKN